LVTQNATPAVVQLGHESVAMRLPCGKLRFRPDACL
jgi:hypothetical protein